MAIQHTRRHLLSSATPPPTPIATAKGLKSAAVDDRILSEYLGKTLQVPELILPSKSSGHLPTPLEINFSSLASSDDDAIRDLLRSADEFGVFRIIHHDISEGLQFLLEEALWIVNNSKEKSGDRKFCFTPGDATDNILEEEIGPDTYRRFRQKMEDMYNRLEAVTKVVGQILSEHMRKIQPEKIQKREPVLCLHRNKFDGQDEKDMHFSEHALSLYLTNKDQEVHVQSCRGLLSSKMHKGTILFVAGKELEDWSEGRFKFISKEPVFEPTDGEENTSYIMKFKSSPTTLTDNLYPMPKTITLNRQILIFLVMIFLYNCFKYILLIFMET